MGSLGFLPLLRFAVMSTKEQEYKPTNILSFASEDLERLKQIHFNHTGISLTDQEVFELGISLVNLHQPIVFPVPASYSVENAASK